MTGIVVVIPVSTEGKISKETEGKLTLEACKIYELLKKSCSGSTKIIGEFYPKEGHLSDENLEKLLLVGMSPARLL